MATDGSPEDAMLQLILSQLEGGGNPLFTPVRALSVDDIDSLRDGATASRAVLSTWRSATSGASRMGCSRFGSTCRHEKA
jgi:hypothetical protein